MCYCVLLFLSVIIICYTHGQDEPDITMLSSRDIHICVAGQNTEEYGVTFMSTNLNHFKYGSFIYRSASDIETDSLDNCEFNSTATCTDIWKRNGVKLYELYNISISPIIDDRWNNFEIYITDGINFISPKYDKDWIFESDPFYIGISVRGTQDAHILLCSSYPRTSPCYWIIIDGFMDKNLSVIRKCIHGIPDRWATEPDCREIRSSISTNEKFLNETKWTHFLLSKDKGNIQLWLWDINMGPRLLLHYTDENYFITRYMFVKSYNSIAHWKVHTNSYLNINYKRKPFRLGPPIRFPKGTSLCISLFVIMCPNCSMSLTLESEETNTTITKIIQENNNSQFLTWKYIKIQNENLSTSRDSVYHLRVNTIGEGINNTFWGIDNFRKCSNDEIRVGQKYEISNLTCQSLKYPNWTFTSQEVVQEFDVAPPICSNLKYIGKHCNISCKSVLKRTYCDFSKICITKQEGSTSAACTCSAGYVWSTGCNTACNLGYYGYNCYKKCGYCRNVDRCNFITGECNKGCQKGYVPPLCQETLPHFKYPVKIIDIYYTSVVVRFEKINIEGAMNLTHLVVLECKETTRINWEDCSAAVNLVPGLLVTVDNLKKETSYMIRAIIYTSIGDAYRKEDVPYTNVMTSCEVMKMIKINTNSRNATVTLKDTPDGCALLNYKYQLMHNEEEIESKQIFYESIVLLNLIPYTQYKIIITNALNASYELIKKFTTNQDAPSEIRNLNVEDRSDTKMTLFWNEPSEKNGIIQKYIVTYEIIQRINCNKTPNSELHRISTKPSNTTIVKLTHLVPYSRYQVKIFAETILPGREVTIYIETLPTDTVYEEELQDLVKVSITKENEVSFHYTRDCLTGNGPLYLQIIFKCPTNTWCKTKLYERLVGEELHTFEVIPYTNYSIEIRAKHSIFGDFSTFQKIINISIPGKDPLPVEKFDVFSKNLTSISLRWLDPYPPYGQLEIYRLKYCSKTKCIVKDIFLEVFLCNLWNENYKCFIMSHISARTLYTISISAKNKESNIISSEVTVTSETVENESNAPLNLKYTWEDDEFTLYWNHPFVTNGRLKKFVITLTRDESEIVNHGEISFYRYEYNVEEERKKYSLLINNPVIFSTTYIINICGVNSVYGHNATLLINTPPETPKLTKNIYVENQVISDAIVTIVVPPLKMITTITHCHLYVVVSKVNSNNTKYNNESNQIKQLIFNKIQPNTEAWIAKEITQMNNKTIKIFLGSEESTTSLLLNEIITNRKLESNSEYEISVILVNTYKDKISSNRYSIRVNTSRSFPPALYALFLLLLFIPAGIILYRYIKKRMNNTSYVEANIATNIYLEVLDDTQYEEPREVSDIHTYETIPDTHTYMNIKANSNNIYANI